MSEETRDEMEQVSALASEKNPNKKLSGKKFGILAVAAAVIIALAVGIGIYNTHANRLARQLDLGQKYLLEQNYEQAIVEFDKAIAIDPMNVDAYLGKADAYIGLDNYEQAIETYLAAIKAAPENPDIYLDLAEVYLNTGDRDAALEILREGYKQTRNKRIKNQIDYLEVQVEEETKRLAEAEARRQEEEEAARLATYEPGYEPGQMMPDFSMTDADGNVIHLSDYRGKALYLNFFTTWCPYCYYELPDMQEVKDAYGEELEVVLVDMAESPELASQYASDYGVTLPINQLPDWQVGYYTITGVPESFVLNPDGVIVDKHYGMADHAWMEQAVSAAVRD